MFQAKPQGYHDTHTGVILCFGEHENGGSWLRITAPSSRGSIAISTVQLRHGEIIRADNHPLAGPDAGGDTPEDPDARTLVTPHEDEEADRLRDERLTSIGREEAEEERTEEAEEAEEAEDPDKGGAKHKKAHSHKKG